MKKIRVLHAPTTVGGNPQGLARAERELGLRSWSVSLLQNYFNYSADEVISKSSSRILFEIKRLAFYRKLFSRYDVVHYNYGRTIASASFPPTWKRQSTYLKWLLNWIYYFYTNILNFLELWFLNKLNIPVFVTYQGNDARQGSFCIESQEITVASEVRVGFYTKTSDKEKRKQIALFDKFAEKIYSVNPDLLNVLPKRTIFLPYVHIDLAYWIPNIGNSGKLKIIHAPSHRAFKGTRFVLKAVNLLKEQGFHFNFELIEGLSNSEARKHYETADILIDQLLAGWYGGLAVELMALGKPVICYIREDDLKFIPAQMRQDLPIINASPSSIYSVLKEWLLKPRSELISRARECRRYVEKWHDPLKIAAILKQDYETSLRLRKKSH